MGIISVEHTDRLYWLGRYSERVYTTIRMFAQCYDTMIDDIEEEYDRFCHNLDIPNIYQSGEDFIERYCFDESDPNSIYATCCGLMITPLCCGKKSAVKLCPTYSLPYTKCRKHTSLRHL